MVFVESDRGVRQVFLYPFNEGRGHVDGDICDVVRIVMVLLEVFGKCSHCLRALAFCHKNGPLFSQIDKERNKPAGIVGASTGQTGTAQAQAQLRNVMIYLGVELLGQPELYIQASRTFDENGQVLEASKEFLQNYIKKLVLHINANKK